MSWYYTNKLESGGVCLSSLQIARPTKKIFYPFINNKLVKATDDFESFLKVYPQKILDRLDSWGLHYKMSKIPHIPDRDIENSKGLYISHNEEMLQNISAKQLHWAINIPRFFSERSSSYAVVRWVIDQFSLDITEMETFILAHTISAEIGQAKEYIYVYSATPYDQTMLNGHLASRDLDTIMSRLYDVDDPSYSEPLSEGYIYWSDIEVKQHATPRDKSKYHSCVVFEPVCLTAGLKTIKPFADNLQTAAHILRKYLTKWENGNE